MNDREQLLQCRTPAPPLTKGLDDRPPPLPPYQRVWMTARLHVVTYSF